MDFRVRGNSVQVFKTVIDKKTLKITRVPAGSANVKTGILSEQLLASLNEKEIQDVRRWLAARQKMEELRMEIDAYFLDQQIYAAIEWLKVAPTQKAAEVVSEVLGAMATFRSVASQLGLVKGAAPAAGADKKR